jgi:hypothetical protein
MKTKRKKEKMNTPEAVVKPTGKRLFLKMAAPGSLLGNPCCTVRDPEKEKGLQALLKDVSKKRKEESNRG